MRQFQYRRGLGAAEGSGFCHQPHSTDAHMVFIQQGGAAYQPVCTPNRPAAAAAPGTAPCGGEGPDGRCAFDHFDGPYVLEAASLVGMDGIALNNSAVSALACHLKKLQALELRHVHISSVAVLPVIATLS